MSNEKKIWDELLDFIKNPYGVAGLMGNLMAESGLEPVCLEVTYRRKLGMNSQQYTQAVDSGEYTAFVSDGAGYGLQQVTYWEHKEGLLSFAQARGKSIGDLQVQLDYLKLELTQYGAVLGTLKTATSVREASDDVLLRYEKPADTSEKVRARRAAYGEGIYETYADPNWEERMKKPLTVIDSAKRRLGDPYVYAAIGEECTPQNRRKYIRADHPDTVDKCQVLHGQKKSCSGCEYKGRHMYDCRGFTYRCLMDAGIAISTVGCTTQWNDKAAWVQQGTTDDMPDLVCCVYKWNGEKMSHTGLHIGNGRIIHCSGTVKTDDISNRTWTHWAIPVGLYSKTDINNAGRIRAVTVLRRGSKGAEVTKLQKRLNELGYDAGVADGVYGSRTEAAVRQFQSDHELAVDGIAGRATQAALYDEGSIPPGRPEPDPGDDEEPIDHGGNTDIIDLILSHTEAIREHAQAIDDAIREMRT